MEGEGSSAPNVPARWAGRSRPPGPSEERLTWLGNALGNLGTGHVYADVHSSALTYLSLPLQPHLDSFYPSTDIYF